MSAPVKALMGKMPPYKQITSLTVDSSLFFFPLLFPNALPFFLRQFTPLCYYTIFITVVRDV